MNIKKIKFVLFVFAAISFAFLPYSPDEGMYPLSEIRKLDLKSAGLKISPDELYNPNGTSLIDALVNISGCTSSFVSEDGLMITNHHCSFGAIAAASTTEKDYLTNGFYAQNKEDEIPAQGITARITVGYTDVSKEILEAAEKAKDFASRTTAIQAKIKDLVKQEELKDTTIKADVSEMFVGQTYILFKYKIINDVRLVYAPPRAIGEFGGESDNWVWPRHTGDFSFLRAYVGKDGKPAPYSKDNVPFKPKKFLKINPNGVKENDFVFILGYPGRTFKHQPSQFLEFQEKYQLPYVQKTFSSIISILNKYGEMDKAYDLRVAAPRAKSLANTEKNYRGKLQGLKRLDLVNKKKGEEAELQKFIENDSKLKKEFSTILSDIDNVYKEIFEAGRVPYFFSILTSQVTLYRLAEFLVDYSDEIKKPVAERRFFFRSEKNMKEYLSELFAEYNANADKEIFKKILGDARNYKELSFIEAIKSNDNSNEKAEKVVDAFYSVSSLTDSTKYYSLLNKPFDEIKKMNDPVVNFVLSIRPVIQKYQSTNNERQGRLNILLAKFMDVKRMYLNKTFIPDANSTLRLTYGYIKGYSPADATYYSPLTTLKGIIEKGADEGDYKLNNKVGELAAKKEYGRWKDESLNDVPVAMAYNTDTSGGNSGSPVLNAYGELIGVNFDRSFEATINDYAWSDTYSRSIGVDIRFVLWVVDKVSNADNLIKELKI